jgi:tetratricopeptide (TPR) repeat protein
VGKQTTALNHYVKAINVAPRSVEARNGYVLPLLALSRYSDAEKACRQVLIIDPKNYYANLRLVYSLRLQDKLEEATKLAPQMLILYPSNVYFLLEHALVLTASGKNAEARPIYQKVLLVSPANAIATKALAPQAAATDKVNATKFATARAAD